MIIYFISLFHHTICHALDFFNFTGTRRSKIHINGSVNLKISGSLATDLAFSTCATQYEERSSRIMKGSFRIECHKKQRGHPPLAAHKLTNEELVCFGSCRIYFLIATSGSNTNLSRLAPLRYFMADFLTVSAFTASRSLG